MRAAALAIACAAALTLAACEKAPTPPPPPKLTLQPASFADLPGWRDDAPTAALAAFRRSCTRIARLQDSADMGAGGVAGTAADWRAPCAAAATVADDATAARSFFEVAFVPFRAGNNGEAKGLFTGYYEPELRGARTRGGAFVVPLYGRPADLITVDLGAFVETLRGQRIVGRVREGALIPYPARDEIEGGALANLRRADGGGPLELIWVDDSIDAFFLQIQGSGRVVLTDGSLMRVGFAAQNGRPYFAIGRELVARGALKQEEVTAPAIRAWLAANPDQAKEVMDKNPSFVFFRPLPPPASADDGPPGAEGVPLTPGRSLAVDRRFIPLSVPLWLDVDDPLQPGARVRRLMIAQDTGGAITGPVRGDVFWGAGADAALRAGMMKSGGGYWLLLPRSVAQRRNTVS